MAKIQILFIEDDYIPLLSEFEIEENHHENPKVTPQYSPFQPESSLKPDQLIISVVLVFLVPLPLLPATRHPLPLTNPPPPPPPPPPPRRNMDDDIKLPICKGTRLEDPKKLWFSCEAI